MIDEKRLAEIESQMARTREVAELIRLARLGLWAEKYGIIALNKALAALPKDKE